MCKGVYMHKCMCIYMNVPLHTHKCSYTHKVHTCIYKLKKISAETRRIHRKLTVIGYSQTQILELKRITLHPVKISFTIKAWNKNHVNDKQSPEDDPKV